MSLTRLKQKLKQLHVQKNSDTGICTDNTDHKEWMNRINVQVNKPESWLEFLLCVKEHAFFTDAFARHNHLCVLFEKAFSSIPCEENRRNDAYAQLFIEFAEIKSKYVPEDAQTLLSQARSICKKFSKVHIAAATLEMRLGNNSKARKILEKAKSFQAEPQDEIVLSLKKMKDGLTTEFDSMDLSTTEMSGKCHHENITGTTDVLDCTEDADVSSVTQESDTVPLSKKIVPAAACPHRVLRAYNSTPEVRSVKKMCHTGADGKNRLVISSKSMPPPQRVKRLQLPFSIPAEREEEEKENWNDPFGGFKHLNYANCENKSSTMDSTSMAHSSGYLSMTEPVDTRETKSITAPLSPILCRKYENGIDKKSENMEMFTPRESTTSKKFKSCDMFRPVFVNLKTPVHCKSRGCQDSHNSTKNLLAEISCNRPLIQTSGTDDSHSEEKFIDTHRSPERIIPKPDSQNLTQNSLAPLSHRQLMSQNSTADNQHSVDISSPPLADKPVNKFPSACKKELVKITQKSQDFLEEQQPNYKAQTQKNVIQETPKMHNQQIDSQPQNLNLQSQRKVSSQNNCINNVKPQNATPLQVQKKSNQQCSTAVHPASATPASFMGGLDMLTVNGQLYSVLGIVGRGGSSKVYQVFDEQKMVKSVKVITLDNANDMIIEGYINEINLLKRLQYCERVIRMYDYAHDEENNFLYVVMEYGKPDLATFFKNQVKQGGRLSDHLIKYYWEVMLQAVQALHEEGIIHSDLKPANFLIVDGTLKLIDFGIAKALQHDKTGVIMETQIGTLNYMSPEALMESCADSTLDENGQYRPVYKIGVRSDVWSLGCILYNMVYGQTPFQHITQQFAKLQAICNPKCQIDFPEIQDKLLLDVMKKCLTRTPKERPPIDELLQHPYLCVGS